MAYSIRALEAIGIERCGCCGVAVPRGIVCVVVNDERLYCPSCAPDMLGERETRQAIDDFWRARNINSPR